MTPEAPKSDLPKTKKPGRKRIAKHKLVKKRKIKLNNTSEKKDTQPQQPKSCELPVHEKKTVSHSDVPLKEQRRGRKPLPRNKLVKKRQKKLTDFPAEKLPQQPLSYSAGDLLDSSYTVSLVHRSDTDDSFRAAINSSCPIPVQVEEVITHLSCPTPADHEVDNDNSVVKPTEVIVTLQSMFSEPAGIVSTTDYPTLKEAVVPCATSVQADNVSSGCSCLSWMEVETGSHNHLEGIDFGSCTQQASNLSIPHVEQNECSSVTEVPSTISNQVSDHDYALPGTTGLAHDNVNCEVNTETSVLNSPPSAQVSLEIDKTADVNYQSPSTRSNRPPQIDVTFQDCTVSPPNLDQDPLSSDGEHPFAGQRSNSEPPTLVKVIQSLNRKLPQQWLATPASGGIQVMCLSPQVSVAVQRSVFVPLNGGSARLFIHSTEAAAMMPEAGKTVVSFGDDPDKFQSTILEVVKEIRLLDICCGVDDERFKDIWENVRGCRLDQNVWGESRYPVTVRSDSCSLLVPQRRRRCPQCKKTLDQMRKRLCRREKSGGRPIGATSLLTPRRLKEAVKLRQTALESCRKKCSRKEKRLQELMQREGVDVDRELHDELMEGIGDASKSEGPQKFFLEQLVKAANTEDPRGIRWHPVVIRWALAVKMASSSAYAVMRDSGFIRLPSERTLFDYSNATQTGEGINAHTLQKIADKLVNLEEYQLYHALLFDEMYISQNIVYHKGTGKLVGYTNLTEVEEEIRTLELKLDDESEDSPPPVAKKMLSIMINGICSSVQEVVGSYSTSASLTSETLFEKVWNAISTLETAGIRILTVTADGASSNSSFFDSHPPLHKTDSGVVYDCTNFYAPEADRPIFFLSDPPHLLKTIRNCFANSGAHRKTRLLQKNKQIISWSTIIRLLREEETDDIKFLHKINTNNDFLTGFSSMNVKAAARVMSRTVANAIKMLGYKNCEETVVFITWVDNFFDCLNGAHSDQHERERKPNLAPYTDAKDPRFDFLLSFLDYLKEWEDEVNAEPKLNKTDKAKRLLSYQTIRGIERTVRGFIGAVKFMVGLPKKKTADGKETIISVMARAFQQDRLEHFFSKQRSRGGGSTNPELLGFLSNQNLISVQGELGVKRKRGNTQHIGGKIDLKQPLPKRPRQISRRLNLQQNV